MVTFQSFNKTISRSMIEKYVDLNPKNADDGTQLDIKVSQVPLNLTRGS